MITPTPYDPLNDFAAVATLTSSEKVLVVHPALPVRSLRDLIALARAKPDELNFSSPGMGGLQHLAGELFNILAGVKIQHIPYKGGGQAVSELIGGQVQLSFQNALAVVAHVKSGRLRGLAVSGERRLASLPQIPTFAESGLKGFDVNTWFGVLTRAGAPADIVAKLNAEIGRILQLPDVRDKLVAQEMYPFVSTPEQFTALMRADAARYARVIKTANIKLDTY
jgi:tripartite-type tricarboxylate transporter receptor subunit TctC